MEKFKKIIADGFKEFESFTTPSDLEELKDKLLSVLSELQENLIYAVEQGNEGVKVNDNNNRDSIFDKIEESLQDLKDWCKTGICDPITDAIKDFLLETTNKKIDSNHSLLIAETQEIINRLDDLQTFVVDVLGDKIDALAESTSGGFANLIPNVASIKTDVANVNTNVSSVKTDVADVKSDVGIVKTDVANVNTNVTDVKSDVADINNKLDDVLVGKDALKQAISEKIGREASNTLVGMAADVENIPAPDLNWSSIGMTHSPQALKDAIAYAKGIKDAWEQGAQDKTKFEHTSDSDLWILPNVDLKGNNTTKLSLKQCRNLRVISEELDTSSITDMVECFYGCSALQTIPALDFSNATSMMSTFYSSALNILPILNTHNVKNMNSAFRDMGNLTIILGCDCSSCTNMDYLCHSCTKLAEIPELNSSNVTSMNQSFHSCPSLRKITSIDFLNVTTMSLFFNNPVLTYIVGKNLGNKMTNIDLSQATAWGTGLGVEGDENKESLRKTLVELTPTKTVATTVKLSPNTYAIYETFSDEDKQIIEDKGFTITK